MTQNSLLYSTLASFTVLGLLHFVAESFYFYWTIFWFDIMMHILGGISVALLSLWFISRSKFLGDRIDTPLAKFFAVLLTTLSVSFVWEVLEHATGTAKALEGYLLDTTVDTSAAFLGASITSLFVTHLADRKTTSDSRENF